MTLRFYTYVHRRASDGLVFYVGKGAKNRSHSTQNRNKHWHNTVAKHGVVVEVIAYWFSEEAAFDHEKSLIAEYRKLGFPLCNQTDGGEGASGVVHSAESRAKMAEKRRGKKLSAEQRIKLSASMKGHKVSDETRAKLSRAHKTSAAATAARAKITRKGTKHSPEAIARMSAAHKGHTTSPEHRAKLSAAGKGKKLSAEHRANLSAACVGRKHSPESIAKMSAIRKEHHARKRLEAAG